MRVSEILYRIYIPRQSVWNAACMQLSGLSSVINDDNYNELYVHVK